jgi:hypothetical protein
MKPEASSSSNPTASVPKPPSYPGFRFWRDIPPEEKAERIRWGKRKKRPRPEYDTGSYSSNDTFSDDLTIPKGKELSRPQSPGQLQPKEDEEIRLRPDSQSGRALNSEEETSSVEEILAPQPQPITVLEKNWDAAYSADPHWGKFWNDMNNPDSEWPEGYRLTHHAGHYKLEWDGRICIPHAIALEVMADLHIHNAHLGIKRLIAEWRRRFHLTPSMAIIPLAKRVKRVCPTCQKCDPPNWQLQGPISLNPVPAKIFDSVCLDIFSMPYVEWLGDPYDCMILCVDRMSGWIIARPSLKKGLTAEKVAHLILDHGWNEIGIPSLITSDQGSHFVGQWWKTMCSRLGIRQAYSQAYRPQANGRAEVAGRQIITILRKLNADADINWVEALPRALLAHHDSVGEIGLSPHQIIFGRDRNLPGIPFTSQKEAIDARKFMDHMQDLDHKISTLLNELHQKDAESFNAKRRERRTFKTGDAVWILKPKEVGGNKIYPWWEGPFPIARQVGRDVFAIQITPTELKEVHADQLKRFHQDVILSNGIPLYFSVTAHRQAPLRKVSKIRAHLMTPRGMEFLTHWENTDPKEDTWEGADKFCAVNSPIWLEYCQNQGLYPELTNFPLLEPQPKFDTLP